MSEIKIRDTTVEGSGGLIQKLSCPFCQSLFLDPTTRADHVWERHGKENTKRLMKAHLELRSGPIVIDGDSETFKDDEPVEFKRIGKDEV